MAGATARLMYQQPDLSGVDLAYWLAGYGYQAINRGGGTWVSCPYHPDENPSCRIYDDSDKQRGHCFSCGKTFDAIDLVRHMTGCTYARALSQLGLAVSVPLSQSKKYEAEKRRQQWQDDRDLVAAYKAWINREVDKLALLIRNTHKVMASWKAPEDMTDLGGMIHDLPRFKYEFQILTEGDSMERLSFIYFKTRGKQIENDSETNQRSRH